MEIDEKIRTANEYTKVFRDLIYPDYEEFRIEMFVEDLLAKVKDEKLLKIFIKLIIVPKMPVTTSSKVYQGIKTLLS